MKPKIKDQVALQQAESLKQPVLIRLLRNIDKKLEGSVWTGTYHETPTSYPGYRLDLKSNDYQVSVDMGELCYQVCFQNYQSTHASQESQEVEIDTSLIDETGHVDWTNVDRKTLIIIDNLFDKLSHEINQS